MKILVLLILVNVLALSYAKVCPVKKKPRPSKSTTPASDDTMTTKSSATTMESNSESMETTTEADVPGMETTTEVDTAGMETTTKTDAGGMETTTEADAAGMETTTEVDTAGMETTTKSDSAGMETTTKVDAGGMETTTIADATGMDTTTEADSAGMETTTETDSAGMETTTEADVAGMETTTKADAAEMETTTEGDSESTTGMETTTEEQMNSPTCPQNETLSEFKQALVPFTIKFLKEVIKANDEEKSVVCAPLSTLYDLGLFAIYSFGITYKQLIKALNLKNSDEIRCVLEQINNEIKNSNVPYVPVAGTIFGNAECPFTKAFINDNVNLNLGQAINVDLNVSLSAVNTMNEAAEKQSNGKIENLFTSTDPFDSETSLVLGTPLYFETNFKIKFDLNDVTTGPFYTSNSKSVVIEYLHQRAAYLFKDSWVLKAKLVQIPLVDAYTMLIILPNSKSGLHALLKKLENFELFNREFESMQPAVVDLSIPILTDTNNTSTSTEIDILNILRKTLSIHSLLSPIEAKLTNVADCDENVYVSQGRQKVTLKLNYDKGDQSPMRGEDEDNILPGAVMKLESPFLSIINLNGLPVLAEAMLNV